MPSILCTLVYTFFTAIPTDLLSGTRLFSRLFLVSPLGAVVILNHVSLVSRAHPGVGILHHTFKEAFWSLPLFLIGTFELLLTLNGGVIQFIPKF